jgi:hypothetical protein
VKRITRYVVGTLDHGIYYPRCPREAHLVGYSDSDHAGDIDTSNVANCNAGGAGGPALWSSCHHS